MLVPTVCLSCGFELGQLAEVFRRVREKRLAALLAERKVATKRAANDLAVSMDLSDLFEKLGLPPAQGCCRTCLATSLVWTDHC